MPDFDDDRPESPPAEGVRILGAEEAQAAVEGVPERPRAEEPHAPPARRRRPRTCSPRPGSRCRPTGSRATCPAPTARPAPPPPAGRTTGERSGPMPLPHWTEPPTGEVPMIADEPGRRRGLGAPRATQPRFRSEAGDWAEADFARSATRACTTTPTALGALVDVPDVDEDEEFAAQVAARRGAARAVPARARRAPSAPRRRRARSSRPSRTRPRRRT